MYFNLPPLSLPKTQIETVIDLIPKLTFKLYRMVYNKIILLHGAQRFDPKSWDKKKLDKEKLDHF